MVHVQENCEEIQRYGKRENIDGTPELDEEVCLQRIRDTLKVLKINYEEVAKTLRKFFGVEEVPAEDDDDEEEDDKKQEYNNKKKKKKDEEEESGGEEEEEGNEEQTADAMPRHQGNFGP